MNAKDRLYIRYAADELLLVCTCFTFWIRYTTISVDNVHAVAPQVHLPVKCAGNSLVYYQKTGEPCLTATFNDEYNCGSNHPLCPLALRYWYYKGVR